MTSQANFTGSRSATPRAMAESAALGRCRAAQLAHVGLALVALCCFACIEVGLLNATSMQASVGPSPAVQAGGLLAARDHKLAAVGHRRRRHESCVAFSGAFSVPLRHDCPLDSGGPNRPCTSGHEGDHHEQT